MFRPASRALLRAPGVATRGPAKRLISTTPSEPKGRSWKNTAVRLGLAVGAVYYYNTSSVFAKEPSFSLRGIQPQTPSNESTQTLDSIKPKIREQAAKSEQKPKPQPATDGQEPSEVKAESAEDDQSAAFNPETGEINWDCPCLGGMAHGPCGEDFKAAFSCFIYSEEEPKGIDCIEKFKAMQDCFRQHPDIYGAELDDEPEVQEQPKPAEEVPALATELDTASHPDEKHARAKEVNTQVKSDPASKIEQAESDELLPKAWHDEEGKNKNAEK